MSNQPADSIANIYIDNELQASAVVVGKNAVVTCLHVIHDAFTHKPYSDFDDDELPKNLKIEVEIGGKKYLARIVRGNQHHDLCLLYVDGLNSPALKVAPETYAPQEGDAVFSVAKPEGKILSGGGIVTRLDKIRSGEVPLVQNSAPTIPGCSGGALLNAQNQLIGIQTFMTASTPHIWLRELLTRKDRQIISRTKKSETEVDYFFDASARSLDFQPSHLPFINWLFERPESEFAAGCFVSYHHADFQPKHVANPEDYERVLEILAAHQPRRYKTECRWQEAIEGIIPIGTPCRDKYLLRALESAENNAQKAILLFKLGSHYNYYTQQTELAIEFFEKFTASAPEDKRRGDSVIAHELLCRLYLNNGDRTKAHREFVNAFAAKCVDIGFEDSEHFFKRSLEDITRGADIQIFTGKHQEQKIWRECLKVAREIFPATEPAPIGL